MAGTPRVQLSLKGRLLSEVAFVGPQLRIGRMRENDVVVNNLAVSRFHATLRREGDGYVLEDLGSENGTQLNGERITGTVPMNPSDVIQLGKYELRLVLQPGIQIAGAPKAKPSDAWDASQTFLAMPPAAAGAKPAASPAAPAAARPAADAPAPLPPLAPSPAASSASRAAAPSPAPDAELGIFEEPDLLNDAAEETPAPDPEGVFAFGEEDLGAPEETGAAEDDLVAAALAPPNPEHTSLFDFGAPASPEPGAESALAAVAEPSVPPAEAAPAGRLHAGLIVQRDGKLHLLRPWESGELCAGRAPECEIVLADAGVSRRHAVFSCAHDGYAVRDLDSVNGIYVNGQRTKQHALAVGDVVRIESFELTFVLDHQPIGSEVSGPRPIAPKPQEHGRATQFSLEAPAQEREDELELTSLAGDPNEAPGALAEERSIGAPLEDITDGFEILPPAGDPYAGEAQTADTSAGAEAEADFGVAPADREPVLEAMLPESDLISAEGSDDDEEKGENAHSVLLTQLAEPLSDLSAVPRSAPARLQLRLVVDTAQLSLRAREALAVLAEEGVALAAQVRVEPSEA